MKKKSKKTDTKTKTIQVNYLARVEGEGALFLKFKQEKVEEVQLKIFEPPRFFEAFLQGRRLEEAPDITARICGICPVAYQMSSVQAMEDALEIQVSEPIRQLRRMLYCGEWIESHTLHIYMLHAPDFLGYADAMQMAKDFPEVVQRGLQLKKTGNDLMALIGGREVHPINVRVGGFYRAPSRAELNAFVPRLQAASKAAEQTLEWVAGFDFPELERDYEWVSLVDSSEYPMGQGTIISNGGINIRAQEFENHFEEYQVQHSHALQCRIKNRGAYLVGPMARYNLNRPQLPSKLQAAAQQAGLPKVCKNPFQSILVRSLEVWFACEEALRLIHEYQEPAQSSVSYQPKAAVGFGATEAPRGVLYHRYEIDSQGNIKTAKIVPPTSQNQKTIEEDLAAMVPKYSDLPDEDLQWRCEQAIRNYDPCISCATHFLKMNIERYS